MSNQERVAIYVRVSSSHQEKEGASLETQEAACRKYAAEKGWITQDRHVYRETHKRWVLHERPEMSRLRTAAKAGEFDVVLCYCVDRLSSKDAHVYILEEELDKVGVQLDFATEEFEQTAIGRFVRSAKVLAADIEVEKISERTVRGRKARITDRGLLIPGGKPPYGYLWPDDRDHKGRLIEDPATAPVVMRMFQEIATGTTLMGLARMLMNEGVPPPTGTSSKWHTSTIALILHKPAYKGEASAWGWTKTVKGSPQRFDPEKAIPLPAGTIPALVSPEIWDAVQGILERNKAKSIRSAKNPEGALLRGGYVICGYCGGKMYPRPRSNGMLEYVCRRGSEFPRECERPSIVAHRLDADVWHKVTSVLTNPGKIREQLELQQSEGIDPLVDELKANERRLMQLDKRQAVTANAVTMLSSPDAAAPLVSQLEQIAAQKRLVIAERDRLKATQDEWLTKQTDLAEFEAWCSSVAANLSELTYQQKRIALDVFQIQVTVYRADRSPRWAITPSMSPTLSTTT